MSEDTGKKKWFGFDLGDFAATLGGALLARFVIEKEVGGKKVREINPKTLRQEAPHFAKDQKDEARFAQIVDELPPALRKIILEHWMPTLGLHQKADFILSCAEMTVGETPTEKIINKQKTVDMLVYLARIPNNTRRTTSAASLRFIKPKEGDYLLVKLQDQAKAALPKIKAAALSARTHSIDSADAEIANLRNANNWVSNLKQRLRR